ncbi:MAG: hypothetical protein AAB411_00990 [Patescibacteria group bacterium]
MEIQNNQINNLNKQKSRFRKFILAFFVVIIGAFVLFIMVAWGWQKYRYWQDEKIAQKAEEGIRKWQQEDYERAMADTYGGKTPQETLQMYIDAVEKGDYELASKYFIGSKQEKELKSLKNSERKNIENMINQLKQVLKSVGSFSWDKKEFAIRKPILVDFKLYPNNIWKIIEI